MRRKLYTTTRTSLCSVLRSFKSQSLCIGTVGEVQNFSKSHSLYGGKFGNFPSPRGYIEGQSLYGGNMEFFQVPGSLYRERGIYDDLHRASISALLF